MKKVAIALSFALFLSGCGYTVFDITRNRENLNKLESGMTKAQVLEIMGEPYKREMVGETEWLLYWTEPYESTEEKRFTPIVFEGGKVIGWGRNYWTTREQKYDIKLEQTTKRAD